MTEQIPAVMLKKHPQLEQIFNAIDEYKDTSTTTITCKKCNGVITVTDNQNIGSLSTNCSCGHCKYSMSWDAKS